MCVRTMDAKATEFSSHRPRISQLCGRADCFVPGRHGDPGQRGSVNSVAPERFCSLLRSTGRKKYVSPLFSHVPFYGIRRGREANISNIDIQHAPYILGIKCVCFLILRDSELASF